MYCPNLVIAFCLLCVNWCLFSLLVPMTLEVVGTSCCLALSSSKSPCSCPEAGESNIHFASGESQKPFATYRNCSKLYPAGKSYSWTKKTKPILTYLNKLRPSIKKGFSVEYRLVETGDFTGAYTPYLTTTPSEGTNLCSPLHLLWSPPLKHINVNAMISQVDPLHELPPWASGKQWSFHLLALHNKHLQALKVPGCQCS